MSRKIYNPSIKLVILLALALVFISDYALAQRQSGPLNDTQERDPFIALVTNDGRLLKFERKSSGPVEVEGIIYDSQGLSYVIVNEDILGIGDWVGEYQLYKIEKDKVIFLKQGQELEVIVKEEE